MAEGGSVKVERRGPGGRAIPRGTRLGPYRRQARVAVGRGGQGKNLGLNDPAAWRADVLANIRPPSIRFGTVPRT